MERTYETLLCGVSTKINSRSGEDDYDKTPGLFLQPDRAV